MIIFTFTNNNRTYFTWYLGDSFRCSTMFTMYYMYTVQNKCFSEKKILTLSVDESLYCH